MNTFPVSADRVIQLLRQLPPRERLRVMAEVLPSLESDLSGDLPSTDFWQGVDVRVLAEQQGVQPVDDFDALSGGWPEDESVDDFILAVRECRRQNPAEVSS